LLLLLYCSAYLVFECRCMSDGVLIQFVCQVFNLVVIQNKVYQRFVCVVFVVPIAPTRIT
jgi:hypothetical protein